ncbi:MAG: PqqD family protein [Jatrophihabitantaceae bacterium]
MSSRYAPSTGVTAEELDDGMCLYHSGRDEVLVLNQTAADVWQLSDGELDLTGIVRQLAGIYATEAEALRADVTAVVDELAGKGYLHEVSESDRSPG